MKIYDISQEVFNCAVYPGDPQPIREVKLKISEGAICNLTAFEMCAHNGTHVDAPYHFIDGEETIDRVPLGKFIGYAYVAEHDGDITAEAAEKILKDAKLAETAYLKESSCGRNDQALCAYERILVKGNAVMTKEGAEVFAKAGIKLFGNESQTVGPLDAPMEVHLVMLGAKIVLLEGIRLAEVPVGVYLLNAAPINLGGSDGAPCRAVLMDLT